MDIGRWTFDPQVLVYCPTSNVLVLKSTYALYFRNRHRLFLGVLRLGKQEKTLADTILSGWMFLFGLHLLLYYLFFFRKIFDLPFLLGVDAPLPLVYGPLLFLYTYALCRQHLPAKGMLHFLPVLACILYRAPPSTLPAADNSPTIAIPSAGHAEMAPLSSEDLAGAALPSEPPTDRKKYLKYRIPGLGGRPREPPVHAAG